MRDRPDEEEARIAVNARVRNALFGVIDSVTTDDEQASPVVARLTLLGGVRRKTRHSTTSCISGVRTSPKHP
jgi:hypothetical protein